MDHDKKKLSVFKNSVTRIGHDKSGTKSHISYVRSMQIVQHLMLIIAELQQELDHEVADDERSYIIQDDNGEEGG